MIQYVSTKGGISPVGFEQAVLQGFAEDGGLFVPEKIPAITPDQVKAWAELSYTELAFEMLSLFIDRSIIPESDLKKLIHTSFSGFEHPEVIPFTFLDEDDPLIMMELFHGPTLSFKDIAMGFLMNVMDYFLTKNQKHVSLILATTGDTGPAAAHAAAGKKTIDCWPLYPAGMISEEQERQMATLEAANIHPVGVENCPDGGDDLDLVVAALFSDQDLKQKLELSSVNSINWCRVMVQSIHYAYGYYRTCGQVGNPVVFSVPSGAFGNMFAGLLAREMGFPIQTFICANNRNQALHRAFSHGVFEKKDLIQTVSSAIDIVVPYNFWRFLYFNSGCDSEKLRSWMEQFQSTGKVSLDSETLFSIRKGFQSVSVSDEETLEIIREIYENHRYLLDPHGAVAVCAAKKLSPEYDPEAKVVCQVTAHPGKFPAVVHKALGKDSDLPEQANHSSLILAKTRDQKRQICDYPELESLLIKDIRHTIKQSD